MTKISYIQFLVKVYKKIVREGWNPENFDDVWRGYGALTPFYPTKSWVEKFITELPEIKRVSHLDEFRASSCRNERWLPGGILELTK